MRHRPRIDANQQAIVKALRQAGASVQSLASIGLGVPDLLVGFCGVNYLVEVKDGSAPPSRRLLTDAELDWQSRWAGQAKTAGSPVEALAIIGVTAKPDPLEQLGKVLAESMARAPK